MKTIIQAVLLLALVGTTTTAFAQVKRKPKATPKSTPAVIKQTDNNSFVSRAEKFSIALDKDGAEPTPILSGEMYGVDFGKQYSWLTDIGTVKVTYAKFQYTMRSEKDFLAFAGGIREGVGTNYDGEINHEKMVKTGKFRLLEYFFTLPDGGYVMTRWHISTTEYYCIFAAMNKKSPENSAATLKIMDSFKILP